MNTETAKYLEIFETLPMGSKDHLIFQVEQGEGREYGMTKVGATEQLKSNSHGWDEFDGVDLETVNFSTVYREIKKKYVDD